MKQIEIFTDGSCLVNPGGPGGWAAVLKFNDNVKEISGGVRASTNNRMEMTAAVEALKTLKEPCRVILHTDSQYLKNAFTNGWIKNWKKNGWKTAAKKPVKNKDLWLVLDELMGKHQVDFKFVRGHSGHPENERCDELAKAAAKSRDKGVDSGYVPGK